MASQENTKIINYDLLINREIELIRKGGSALHLTDLFQQYQFLPSRINEFSNDQMLLYLTSLILSHKFIELKFAIKRNKTLLSQQAIELYRNISNEGINQNFEKLISYTKNLEKLNYCELSPLLTKSIKSYILACLSKNYVTFPIEFMIKAYQISKEDIIENGHKIEGNFVILNEVKRNNEGNNLGKLMQQRVRQLSSITQNIIKR